MAARRTLRDIDTAHQKLLTTSYSYGSGKKNQFAYDDPVAANLLSRLNNDKKNLTKYYSNIDNARSAISDTETALTDINKCMLKIIELANSANNETLPKSGKVAIADEILQYKEQIISDLNYSSSGIFIFGGFSTKTSPIKEVAGTYLYNGLDIESMDQAQRDFEITQKVRVNISKGMNMDIRVSALEIMGSGPDNLLTTLDNITNEILADDFDIEKYKDLGKVLEDNYDRILGHLTKIGTAANRLDSVHTQLKSREETLKTRISDIEDMEIEEAIINYKLAEQAYEAALSASVSVIQLSLLDFIR